MPEPTPEPTPGDRAIALLRRLLTAAWYSSAIELDPYAKPPLDGAALREEVQAIIRDGDRRQEAPVDLLRRALIVVEAHADEYPDARPLAAELRRYLDK